MQAVKEKLQDMSTMRKAKAKAKAEEKAEKQLAKTRVEVAHEVLLAREAEAQMELHVARAGGKAQKEIAKHASEEQNASNNAVPDPNAAGAAPPSLAGAALAQLNP